METFKQHDLSKMDKVTNKNTKKVTLAEGEATNHFHVIESDTVEMWVDTKDTTKKTIQTYGPVEITHEEHDKIKIETPGGYDISIVNEFDHMKEEAKKVVD